MGLVRLVFQTRKPVAAAQNPATNKRIFFMALNPPRVAILRLSCGPRQRIGLDARKGFGGYSGVRHEEGFAG
jgi:hypothetical protein